MKYLTAADIAERLQISRAAAYRVAGQCLHIRVGRLVRVPEDALTKYLANRIDDARR